jgi:hypothetical protein
MSGVLQSAVPLHGRSTHLLVWQTLPTLHSELSVHFVSELPLSHAANTPATINAAERIHRFFIFNSSEFPAQGNWPTGL